MNQLPETGFVRLPQIIGVKEVTPEEAQRNRCEADGEKKAGRKPNTRPKRAKKSMPGVLPIGKSSWWVGIKCGKYPRPEYPFGPRIACWRVEFIRALIKRAAA